jgi:hypothetical protein
MSRSVARTVDSTPLHTLDLRMAKASIPVHQQESSGEPAMPQDAVSLVLETLAAIGMSDKEACIHMGYDASLFSKVKRGDARLPWDALWKLPDLFWVEFHQRIAVARRITEQSKLDLQAARISELVYLLVRRQTA